jgi:hypothetical protein
MSLYKSLSVAERANIHRLYKKTNPNMSYRDIISDFDKEESLPQYGGGGETDPTKPKPKPAIQPYQAKDEADYKYRQQMYSDSLNLYNEGQKRLLEFYNTQHNNQFKPEPYDKNTNYITPLRNNFQGIEPTQVAGNENTIYLYDKPKQPVILHQSPPRPAYDKMPIRQPQSDTSRPGMQRRNVPEMPVGYRTQANYNYPNITDIYENGVPTYHENKAGEIIPYGSKFPTGWQYADPLAYGGYIDWTKTYK